MTQRTVEVIVKVATELFDWGVSLLKEKRRKNNDSKRSTKKK